MARVFLGLGSNTQKHKHLCAGLDALAQTFGPLDISPVYESLSVGFDGRNFYNLVVGIHTSLDVAALSKALKAIEDANGRLRDGPKFAPRTLDIDILTYDDLVGVYAGVELPRDEVWLNAFVLRPLSELAPDDILPGRSETYAALWQAYSNPSQKLWPVSFIWCGRELSPVAS
ncbi:2-amino-4-hydroxy-6-hydroxymethyldihydropteridine diphosphokinase [Simiduia agarivorans]|uniref:2-amino-4-hydroxy-6-hydroxymethyldihydropteridine diphosphokinase n=1 Tax=Simiduia agarivorans (strain DSM 21679 / JCM 13881 / BCRC 17597 / SA1) TaxID=1117647 RepID=K4KJB8_SIMAS|nr:2-amino-4-hydroxy-6-hydroxymethyldihydropteridine diphosphokinase [Simiduia agarivorans]AFU99136.1 putative phosphokinase [Simiduia agarivorans SA1 = DSM 21679]